MALISEIFTSETVEKAIERAALRFGVSADKLTVEVLAEPKKGFLGIGAALAKIQVTFDDGTAVAAPKKSATPKSVSPQRPRSSETSAPAPAPAPRAPRQAAPAPAPKPEREPRVVTAASPAGVAAAKAFLSQIITDTGVVASVTETQGSEPGTFLEITGEGAGALIGYHGETLEALQFLAGIVAARADEDTNSEDTGRIYLDIDGYKVKREETLRRLAHKTAEKARRLRKNIPLDPMSANDRRIIHSALQNESDVTTYSIGTDSNRRVIVAIDGSTGAGRR